MQVITDANDAMLTENMARRMSQINTSNALSAQLRQQTAVLGTRHQETKNSVANSVQTAFDVGVKRGMAMHVAGVRNREPVGVDLLAGVDVDGYMNWAQQQRSAFDQFYDSLNPVQKAAFDAGVWVNEQVIDTGIAIGNTVET